MLIFLLSHVFVFGVLLILSHILFYLIYVEDHERWFPNTQICTLRKYLIFPCAIGMVGYLCLVCAHPLPPEDPNPIHLISGILLSLVAGFLYLYYIFPDDKL